MYKRKKIFVPILGAEIIILMKSILFFLVVIVFVSCSNGNRVVGDVEKRELESMTDSTVIVNMEACMVGRKNLSEIICDVSYLELEATEGSYLTIPVNIKLTDSLIYVLDLDGHLRCFDRKGRFLHNGYKKGKGRSEVINLYDFDVDEDYLYLLDGARSAILKYTHDGRFVDLYQLSFRAIRFKQMYNGWYMFALAPFTLTDKEESYNVVLTDSSFAVKKKYFASLSIEKSVPVSRTPYFENSANAVYFAPIYQRGVYQLEDSVLLMKYYFKFNTPYFEPSKKVKGYEDAQEKGILYTYENPIHSNDYLVQNFYTSKDVKGLFFYDLHKDKSLFVKEIVNDMDNVLRFNFDLTKFYDVHHNMFIGLTDVYFKGAHAEEEIEKGTSHLSDAAKSILVRKEGDEGINPILMFYRFRKDIIE